MVEEMAVFGVLAGGVVLLVDRLRRVQQRHRPDGLRIVLPPHDVAALEGQLRRQADLSPLATAGSLVASLHVAAAEAGLPVPLVAALRIGAGTGELALVAGDDPTTGVDASRWRDPLDQHAGRLLVPGSAPGWWTPVPAAARRHGVQWPALLGNATGYGGRRRGGRLDALVGPPPVELVEPGTLVTLGVEDGQLVLVDLAVLGALALQGPWANGALRAMAVELATAPMAVEVELVLVGFSETFDVFDRARRIDDLTRAVTLAELCVAELDDERHVREMDPNGRHGDRGAPRGSADLGGGVPLASGAGIVASDRRDVLDPVVTTVFLCASPCSSPAGAVDPAGALGSVVASARPGQLDGPRHHTGAGGRNGTGWQDRPGVLDGVEHLAGSGGPDGLVAPREPTGHRWDAEEESARRLAELACASDGLVAAVFGWPVPAAPWQAGARGGRVVLEHCPDGGSQPSGRSAADTVVFGDTAEHLATGSASGDEARARERSQASQSLARVRPQQLNAQRAEQVGSLLRAASNLRGVDPDERSEDTGVSGPGSSPGLVVGERAGCLGSPFAGPAGSLIDPGSDGACADPAPPSALTEPDTAMVAADGVLRKTGEAGAGTPLFAGGVVDDQCSAAGPRDISRARCRDGLRARSQVAPGTVEVQVLGPVQVLGAERPFTRAWTLDLVVYLALHPAGASTEQWSTALWPDRLMASASLHSTASAARRALGANADGVDHLPHSHGRLRLSASVTSDWQTFTTSAAEGEPEGWRRSLELVRGRPFDGIRAVDWAILEGVLPIIESSVVDVANQLATWALDIGDAATAQWAARQGLLVSPYDERLYRVLLQAADLAGNPAGVESTMAELVRLVAEDLEPYDAVHPDTLALYRRLSRRGEQVSRR